MMQEEKRNNQSELPRKEKDQEEEEAAPVEGERTHHDDDDDDELTVDNSFWEIKNLNEIPPDLRWWNVAATLFQLIQAAVLFYLSSQADTKWFLFTHFPANLDERGDGAGSMEQEDDFGHPESDEIASYSVTWYSAVFLALSGVDHLFCIILEPTYQYYLQRHQNPFRWAEYTLSASLMRVMIAQLSGITDLHLLFTIFMLTATTMILGACHESVNAKTRADRNHVQNWFPFAAAWVPHLASWAVIACYFFYAVAKGDPPGFVWSIIFILFFLDGLFALLFWLQWSDRRPAFFQDYIVGEKGFILLSFTAKALLAWINYGGGSR